MLLRDYFISLNFCKNGELSRNQIGRSGVQVKKARKIKTITVVRSRSPQYFIRNVPKCKTHVQSDCFCSLNLLFCGVLSSLKLKLLRYDLPQTFEPTFLQSLVIFWVFFRLFVLPRRWKISNNPPLPLLDLKY